jgi:hypothetical protein
MVKVLGGSSLLLEKVISKDSIIKGINQQLEDLINYFEEQLQLLETENSVLKQELLTHKKLLTDKENQIRELTEKVLQQRLKDEDTPKQFSVLQLIQMFPHYISESERLFKQQKNKECIKIVSKLMEVMDQKAYSSSGGNNLVTLSKELIKSDFQKGSEIEELFIKVFYFISMFHQKDEIRKFLSNNITQVTRMVMKTENETLIAELGSILFMKKELQNNLGDFLTLISHHWENLVKKVDQKSLIKILWLDLILNKEKPILNKKDINEEWVDQNLPEVQLYHLYREVIFNQTDISKFSTQIKKLKEKVTVFSSDEKNRLFGNLNNILGEQAKKNRLNEKSKEIINKPKKLRKMSFVTKLPTENLILPGTEIALKDEWVALSVYKDIYTKEPFKYIKAKVLTYNENSKAFVTEQLIQVIKKEAGKNRVDIRDQNDNLKQHHPVKSIPTIVTKKEEQPFVWPSTEIKGQKVEEKGQFNEESELKKLGYQITGTTREKRWRILTTAVKTLGLRKVAYQIAHNVKLRKGQKDGEKKFVYAITEWEYDLAKLKQQYYKNDFSWPNTK